MSVPSSECFHQNLKNNFERERKRGGGARDAAVGPEGHLALVEDISRFLP
jgi:hypothetical protein